MSPQFLFPLLGLLLIALGWPMATRRVPPNRWYGLRVPATFADKTVWYDANAVTCRDMTGLGVIITPIALLLPHVVGVSPISYVLVCALVLGVGSMIFSIRGWRLANRLLRERRGGPAS